MTKKTIRKAVIPAAGFGTRFMPQAKAVPKEMLPLVDKPVIQYVVEEAAEAGIEDILIVISQGKEIIQQHFNHCFELEQRLTATGKQDILEQICEISSLANIHYVYQHELNGLGDAVAHARSFVGDEPFALLLGDTVTVAPQSGVLTQLRKVFEQYEASVVALEQVPREKVCRYGVMAGTLVAPDTYEVSDLVEKPPVNESPSDLVFAARYIFTPHIFDFLSRTSRGRGNEIQLTDAMRLMLEQQKMYGLKIAGHRYDIGNKLDFVKATLDFALQRDDMKEGIREYLRNFSC